MEDLAARMRRYAAELFDSGQVTYELELDDKPGSLKIKMEQRRDLYLIFKETLNNIHKHAAASHVKMHLKRERHRLLLHIEDDGKGFDSTRETSRNGLKNIQARTQKWNGSASVKSEPGKGTVVQVWMPVK